MQVLTYISFAALSFMRSDSFVLNLCTSLHARIAFLIVSSSKHVFAERKFKKKRKFKKDVPKTKNGEQGKN